MQKISQEKKEKLKKLQLLKQKLEAKKGKNPKAEKLIEKLNKITSKSSKSQQNQKEQHLLNRIEKKKQDANEKSKSNKSTLKAKNASNNNSKPPSLLFPVETISKFDLFLSIQSKDLSDERSNKIIELIQKAAENRIQTIQLIAKDLKNKTFKFGLNVNNEHLLTPINLGPEGDSPDAEDFRKFWGDKAELRRFEDGSIRESVFWETKSLAQARSILLRAVNHVLDNHLGIKSKDCVSFDNNRLQNVLLHTIKPFTIGTGDQYRQILLDSKDELEKLLRSLELKLKITGIRSASAVVRGTEVCLEPPVLDHLSFEHSKKDQYLLKSIDLVLQIEQSSSHWPMKLKPLRSIKTAFYLDIYDKLNAKQVPGLCMKFHTDYLDVLYKGYVYRLHLFVPREFSLLQSAKNHKGETNKARLREAILLDKQLKVLPEIASHLAVLNQENVNFGSACRLAKVWISSHLMSEYLNEIAIELIMAKVFMDNSNIYYLRAFVLFLQTLFTFDWYKKPFLVNLNREFTEEQLSKIEQDFSFDRSQFPLMTICTPFDSSPSMWTRQPLTPILPVVFGRLLKLARDSYLHLANCVSASRDNYLQVFQSSTSIFDVTIDLNLDFILNYHYNVDRNSHSNDLHRHCILYHILCSKCKQAKNCPKAAPFPIVQRNYVETFLRLLREQFGQYALFFYDTYGGNRIGMLWKPEAKIPETLDLNRMKAHTLCELADEQGQTQMQLNLEQVLEDIELIGGQLVKQIEVKGLKRDKVIEFPAQSS